MVNTMPISNTNIVGKLHYKTKRNYLERMISKKVYCMKIAKKYEKEYWDGNRKYGYGGYKFIPGRWTKVAKKIIKLLIILYIANYLIFKKPGLLFLVRRILNCTILCIKNYIHII